MAAEEARCRGTCPEGRSQSITRFRLSFGFIIALSSQLGPAFACTVHSKKSVENVGPRDIISGYTFVGLSFPKLHGRFAGARPTVPEPICLVAPFLPRRLAISYNFFKQLQQLTYHKQQQQHGPMSVAFSAWQGTERTVPVGLELQPADYESQYQECIDSPGRSAHFQGLRSSITFLSTRIVLSPWLRAATFVAKCFGISRSFSFWLATSNKPKKNGPNANSGWSANTLKIVSAPSSSWLSSRSRAAIFGGCSGYGIGAWPKYPMFGQKGHSHSESRSGPNPKLFLSLAAASLCNEYIM